MPYLASALLYKSLTKIGFTIAAFYVGGYLAALGAYSSTLDYSLAHSASGEGPSVSSARVAISVVRSSSKSASSGGSGSSPNSTLYHLWWEARARTLAASSDAERYLCGERDS